MVMMGFDRSRFSREFSRVWERPWSEEWMEPLNSLRLEFEAGALDEDAFASRALALLRLTPADRTELERIWTCIFEPIPASLALLRSLATAPRTTLIVVSNTDPWCKRACLETFDLNDLMEDAVCSFASGVKPKGADASMWLEARRRATAQLGATPQAVLAVDDIAAYLQQALDSGAANQSHTFTNPENFALFLREHGWLPAV